jgi:hypothetical protein
MADEFNKSDEVNLASFIKSTRDSNTRLAYDAAKKIYDKIDFKSYISRAIAKSENSARVIFDSGKYGSDIALSEIFAGEEKWSSVITKLSEIVQEQGITCKPIKHRYRCTHCQSMFKLSSRPDNDKYMLCDNCDRGCHYGQWIDIGGVKCLGLLISWPSADESVSVG